MSPFRDAPTVELGPLDVELERAASRAMVALPRGGRVVSSRGPRIEAHVAGALGSLGLCAVAVTALIAYGAHFRLASLADLALCLALLGMGGLSLAVIFRATDRSSAQRTRSGAAVGGDARRVLRRIVRLAGGAERRPTEIHHRRALALRRALRDAAEPDLARWIPDDVLGRGELLLARAEARLGGVRWADDEGRRGRVRALLDAAARHLDDPAPAEADLAALDRIASRLPQRSTSPSLARRARIGGVRARRERIALTNDLLAEDEALALAQSGSARPVPVGNAHARPSRR